MVMLKIDHHHNCVFRPLSTCSVSPPQPNWWRQINKFYYGTHSIVALQYVEWNRETLSQKCLCWHFFLIDKVTKIKRLNAIEERYETVSKNKYTNAQQCIFVWHSSKCWKIQWRLSWVSQSHSLPIHTHPFQDRDKKKRQHREHHWSAFYGQYFQRQYCIVLKINSFRLSLASKYSTCSDLNQILRLFDASYFYHLLPPPKKSCMRR